MRILDHSNNLVGQLLPFKNRWAWELYLKGVKNNWVPNDISMAKDIEQWNLNILSPDEKLLIKRCLGFFAGSESLVSNNLLLNIFSYVNDPCARQYILRQANEEGVHNFTIVYICESLALNPSELYEAYQKIPSIKAKDDFLQRVIRNIDITNIRGEAELSDILTNIITFYIVCEGILFYTGFASLLSLSRNNKIPGIGEQINYSLRDEVLHVEFGTQLIKTIIKQYPELWTEVYQAKIIINIEEAVDLEIAYSKDILPRGILGLTPDLLKDYVAYLGNYRFEQIGITHRITKKPVRNPFPWLSETIELPKLKNFFETRVLEYQTGGLKDDM